jgi:hypothetical protein
MPPFPRQKEPTDQIVSASECRNARRGHEGGRTKDKDSKMPRQNGSNAKASQPNKDHLILPGRMFT